MSGAWHDRRALVVGGSAGLGLGIALALQRAGANVAIAARDADRLTSACDTMVSNFLGNATLHATKMFEDWSPS